MWVARHLRLSSLTSLNNVFYHQIPTGYWNENTRQRSQNPGTKTEESFKHDVPGGTFLIVPLTSKSADSDTKRLLFQEKVTLFISQTMKLWLHYIVGQEFKKLQFNNACPSLKVSNCLLAFSRMTLLHFVSESL
jgi:hypothetical protein